MKPIDPLRLAKRLRAERWRKANPEKHAARIARQRAKRKAEKEDSQ